MAARIECSRCFDVLWMMPAACRHPRPQRCRPRRCRRCCSGRQRQRLRLRRRPCSDWPSASRPWAPSSRPGQTSGAERRAAWQHRARALRCARPAAVAGLAACLADTLRVARACGSAPSPFSAVAGAEGEVLSSSGSVLQRGAECAGAAAVASVGAGGGLTRVPAATAPLRPCCCSSCSVPLCSALRSSGSKGGAAAAVSTSARGVCASVIIDDESEGS